MPEFLERILAACAPIAELDVAYDVELAVSALLGGAYAAADRDRDAAVARFAGDLVDALADRDDRLSGTLLAGLSGVAPPGVAGRAAASDPAVRPAWADAMGTARCTGAWAMSDLFGDQTEYVVAFDYPDPERGGPPHAVCVLVDFNAGTVRDCWVAADPERVLADCRRSAAGDEDLVLDEIDPAAVRGVVPALFAATDELPERPASESLSEERSVVLARLAILPEPAPAPAAPSADEVAAGFLDAPEAAVDGAPADVVEAAARVIAGYAVAPVPPASASRTASTDPAAASAAGSASADHSPASAAGSASADHSAASAAGSASADHSAASAAGSASAGRTDPLRWSPTTVETFLTEWAPRSAVVDEDTVRWLPTVLGAFVTYAGRLSGLPRRAVSATWDAIEAHTGYFVDAMSAPDPGRATAAHLARRMIAEGVDPTDRDSVRAWLRSRSAD